MKLGVLTCMWKRPYVFEIFATGILRLKKDFDLITVSVGSEGAKSRVLCEKYGINYVEYKNSPLGAKFNAGMQEMKRFSPDYVMILGSDDLISTDTVKKVLSFKSDIVGFTDVWFWDCLKKHLHYWPGYGHRDDKKDEYRKGEAIGMGRTLSRELLQKMSWTPWKNEAERGLDWWMSQKLRQLKVKSKVFNLKESGLFAVDLKTKNNICNYILYKTKKDSLDLKGHISSEEIQMMNNDTKLF